MISINALYLSLNLSVTRLWLWAEIPQGELQPSPAEDLINQDNF